MSIFIIGDLHLSFKDGKPSKPMGVFGDNWEGHEEKIKNDWIEKVNENDLVILPGDFSWATYLEDTYEDFKYLNSLPGKKILSKGNHDYWWTTVTSMKKYLKENDFENIDFLYNNSFEFENKIIVGTRGWTLSEDEEDKRLTKREVARLELSIKDGIEKYGDNKEIVVFIHYPPITKTYMNTEYIDIMKKYNIKRCYYAHLHSNSIKDAIEGEIQGIEFKLVSADGLNFKLLKLED